MDPFQVLYEDPRLQSRHLPPRLEEAYGGQLDLPENIVFVNFVGSIDGVVALEDAPPAAIGLANKPDRFLMALLRACADAVLVGAGTLRADKDHAWTAAYLAPEFEKDFADLRRSLGKTDELLLAVASRSAALDPRSRALKNALVLTENPSCAHLEKAGISVARLKDSSPHSIIGELRGRGCKTILCEGGPTFLAELFADELVNELFLTVSPVVAGRGPGEHRPGLVEGHLFEAGSFPIARLISARLAGSHLFLRYGFSAADSQTRGPGKMPGPLEGNLFI